MEQIGDFFDAQYNNEIEIRNRNNINNNLDFYGHQDLIENTILNRVGREHYERVRDEIRNHLRNHLINDVYFRLFNVFRDEETKNKVYKIDINKKPLLFGECCICLEENQKFITFNCNHSTCEKCYLKLFKSYNNCPLCRGYIKSINRTKTYVKLLEKIKTIKKK